MSVSTIDEGLVPSYPIAIQKAVLTVHCLDYFRKFTLSTQQILVEIIIRLDQFNLQKPFWFKRTKVAAKLRLDRKTVYNALKSLEDDGLIIRHEQEIDSSGFFTCAQIQASDKLIDLLDMTPKPLDRGENNHINRGEKTKLSTYNCSDNLKKQSERNSHIHEQKKQRTKLFDDPALKLLKEQGLTDQAIYALMGICKKVKQRLSDVVNFIGARINKISTPREIFAYLKKCILSEQDFAFKLRRKTEQNIAEDQQITEKNTFKHEVNNFKISAVGKKFKSIKNGAIYTVSKDGWGHKLNDIAVISIYDFYLAFKKGNFILLSDDSLSQPAAPNETLKTKSSLSQLFENIVKNKNINKDGTKFMHA